jgi:hypothetical protein
MLHSKACSTIVSKRTVGRVARACGAGGLAPALVASLTACSSTQAPAAPLPIPPAQAAEAPWRGDRIPMTALPQPYSAAWSGADNREACALIAFSDASATQDATARVATFSGGWGVAYDHAQLRSAFGVAGTGVKAAEPAYNEWPYRLSWSDGSSVGYGPEGGTGPNQLAYLTIAGQECLYNVWSRIGRTHLEQLLGTLRFVVTTGS